MRIPEKNEDLIGKVCVCSTGRVAVVTGTARFPWGLTWTGLGLDGKGTWCSTVPAVVAETGQEFHDKLLKRFDGQMSLYS